MSRFHLASTAKNAIDMLKDFTVICRSIKGDDGPPIPLTVKLFLLRQLKLNHLMQCDAQDGEYAAAPAPASKSEPLSACHAATTSMQDDQVH